MKIVINKCFGGFGLSIAGEKLYAEKSGFELFHYKQTAYAHDGGADIYVRAKDDDGSLFTTALTKDYGETFSCGIKNDDFWSHYDIERTDPILIEVVEELGKAANGECASLSVVEIPDGVEWEIDEYDGNEHIAEKHNTWS